jgi:hypothetical protein
MGTIKSKIIKDLGLLLQEYSGELCINDMAAYFEELYNDPDYLSVKFIFSDFSNAIFSLSERDISEIAIYILNHAPKVQHVNNAILVKTPLVTAYSILYQEITKVMPLYACKIFSTFNGAARFIENDVQNLKSLINNSFASKNGNEIVVLNSKP